MCLTTIAAVASLVTTLAAGPIPSGEVTLPLADYLALQERIAAAERAAPQQGAAPSMALTAEELTITFDPPAARLHGRYVVERRGARPEAVEIPFPGWPAGVTIEPPDAAVLDRSADGTLRLVARGLGTVHLQLEGQLPVASSDGVYRLTLPASTAALRTATLDFPEALSWNASGAAALDESAAAGRRQVHLALGRGLEQAIELEPRLESGGVRGPVVHTDTVTWLDLDGETGRRNDLVFYEVLRGALTTFELDLPPGLAVERVESDEGEVPPIESPGHLTVPRRGRLTGGGYVRLTSPLPPAGGAIAVAGVRPAFPVSAHYLVVAAAAAAEIAPSPAAAWARVDLGDLPRPLRGDLAALAPTAAWRRIGGPPPEELILSYRAAPPARFSTALVASRDTTTLLTREGSLVHRDVLAVRRQLPALEVTLPSASTLWSAVDGIAVRPLRHGRQLTVPLVFESSGETSVELVVVEQRPIDRGRSVLQLELPRLAPPVLTHRWRVLLPEGRRYRLAESTLSPVPRDAAIAARRSLAAATGATVAAARPGVIRGRVVDPDGEPLPGVTVEARSPALAGPRQTTTAGDGSFGLLGLMPGVYHLTARLEGFQTVERQLRLSQHQGTWAEIRLPLESVAEEILVRGGRSSGLSQRRERELAEEAERQRRLDQAVEQLSRGLVEGVKPLAVTVPESGKLLLLAGVLPPPEVVATVEVKAGR